MINSEAHLYMVATPIGNLQDITQRALGVLKDVAIIAAEDTRHTRRLLNHYGIDAKVLSLNAHNEAARVQTIVGYLQKNQSVAIVSDAGTPTISDPGYRLVRAVRDAGFTAIAIPGPSAIVAALSISGLPADQFVFAGFLPSQGGKRKTALASLVNESRSMVFYESTHRIVNFIDLLAEIFGEDRQICIARELTKQYETSRLASVKEIKAWLQADSNQTRGEFVVIVAGALQLKSTELPHSARKVLSVLLQELSLKQAVKLAVSITGEPKKLLYQYALSLS